MALVIVSMTPLQTLTLYNAVANNGEMVKPQFVSEIKEWNKTIKKYNKEVINPKICSIETIGKLKAVLQMWLKEERVKIYILKIFRWQEKQEQLKPIMVKMVEAKSITSSFRWLLSG